jgi:hypothetical protein
MACFAAMAKMPESGIIIRPMPTYATPHFAPIDTMFPW